MGILAVEDDLVATIKAAVTDKVRTVESLPGDWDDDMLRRLLRQVPGVFVAFAGGAPVQSGATSAEMRGQWVVFVVTGHASGEAARRRGDARQVGAYELAELLIPVLHGHRIAGVGSFTFAGLENLYTGQIDRTGVAVYGLKFELPMSWSAEPDAGLLGDFETFDARWDLPPLATDTEHREWLETPPDYGNSQPDAQDTVSVPQ